MSKYENQILIFPDYLEEFPDTDELVWILGKQHPFKTEKSKLLSDISARLWFTYRRKFSPIGRYITYCAVLFSLVDSLPEVINGITETSELTAHSGKEFDLGEQVSLTFHPKMSLWK